MGKGGPSAIPELVKKFEKEILEEWLKAQLAAVTLRPELLREGDLRSQSAEFLKLLQTALSAGDIADIGTPDWAPVRDFLEDLSRSRAAQAFSPSETATFVFSLKQPLFARIQARGEKDFQTQTEDVWALNVLLDKLGLFTTEVYQKSREKLIERQHMDILELSTPVVKLWDGILAVPLIGTLDSARTQVVMESLLRAIVETGSPVAILDITGVPTVDTLVAQHLIKTATAARLMGAECIISGIRPQIAQTIVHLGVTLSDVVTKATMADAFALALAKTGHRVTRG